MWRLLPAFRPSLAKPLHLVRLMRNLSLPWFAAVVVAAGQSPHSRAQSFWVSFQSAGMSRFGVRQLGTLQAPPLDPAGLTRCVVLRGLAFLLLLFTGDFVCQQGSSRKCALGLACR